MEYYKICTNTVVMQCITNKYDQFMFCFHSVCWGCKATGNVKWKRRYSEPSESCPSTFAAINIHWLFSSLMYIMYLGHVYKYIMVIVICGTLTFLENFYDNYAKYEFSYSCYHRDTQISSVQMWGPRTRVTEVSKDFQNRK